MDFIDGLEEMLHGNEHIRVRSSLPDARQRLPPAVRMQERKAHTVRYQREVESEAKHQRRELLQPL